MKKIFCVFICILMCMIMKSCTYSQSIDTRLFVSSIGIDINDDGDYSLCLSYPDISEFSPESSKIKEGGSISGFGKTFYNAIYDIVSKTKKSIDFDHVKMVIISSKLVKDRKLFHEVLDYLSHNPQISRRIYMCVGDGDSKDFINFKLKSGEDSQVFISQLIEYNSKKNGIKSITLSNILDYFSQNKNVLIPVLKLNDDKSVMSINGSYVLDDKNYIDEVDLKSSRIINMLRGENDRVVSSILFEDKYIDYESKNVKRRMKIINYKNMDLELNFNITIKNCLDVKHSLSDEFISNLNNDLKSNIKLECMDLLNKFYKNGVDILNLENYIYKFTPKIWMNYISKNANWVEDININLNIINNVTNTENIAF